MKKIFITVAILVVLFIVLFIIGESIGILDGDYVVVRKQSYAENGETVVAIVENEATVKRYYRIMDRVELRPSREGMKSFWFRKGDLQFHDVDSGTNHSLNDPVGVFKGWVAENDMGH